MTVYSIVHCIMLDVGNCNWQGIGVLQQVERICYSLLINLKSFSRVHVKGAKQLAPIKPPLSPAKVHWLSHSSTLGITWLASLPSTMIMIAALGENRTSLITHQHINWASFAIIMAPMFSHCSCQHCILPSVLSVIKPKVVAMTVNRLAVSDLLPGPNLPPEPSILPKKKC